MKSECSIEGLQPLTLALPPCVISSGLSASATSHTRALLGLGTFSSHLNFKLVLVLCAFHYVKILLLLYTIACPI